MKTYTLILLSLIKIISFNRLPSPELITVIEINRHGARTSKKLQPKPLSKLFGEEMMLTPHGYRQQELLGRYIRERYIDNTHFLNHDYSSKQFHIYSTPIQRTLNSAIGFISGLYPNTKTRLIYQNHTIGLISDDTIPILQTSSKHKDTGAGANTKEELSIEILSKKNDMFHRGNCKYKGESLKKRITASYEQIFDLSSFNVTECALQLSNFTNMKIPMNDLGQVNYEKYLSSIQGYLQSYLYHHGKSLEDSFLSKEVIDYVKKSFINDKYGYRVIDSKYNRMITSELFETILERFMNSIDHPDQGGFDVYSAHDTTIMNIFMNLLRNDKLKEYARMAVSDNEYYDFLFPPFASVLLFELNKLNGQYYVTIEYNGNKIESDLKYIDNDQVIRGSIAFNDFKRMLRKLIEREYKELICGGHSIRNKGNEKDDDKNEDGNKADVANENNRKDLYQGEEYLDEEDVLDDDDNDNEIDTDMSSGSIFNTHIYTEYNRI